MHQLPRVSRNAGTQRSSEQQNSQPTRTPSNVDLNLCADRANSDMDYTRNAGRERADSIASQEKEQTKLNQIIQNFHTKAALVICSSRASLPQTPNKSGDPKQNRWFNLILDDTDALYDDLQEWKRPDLVDNRPVPLVIEVFVDTSSLTPNQALVITDSNDRKWDIAESVAPSTHRGVEIREVLLERWTIQLGDAEGYTTSQLNDQLPNVYKRGVLLFRSLFTYCRLVPAWKLFRRVHRPSGSPGSLRLKFRIKRGPQGRSSSRLLQENAFPALCPSDLDTPKTYEAHSFEPLICPAGPMSVNVQFRKNCDLSVAASEALLSSRFAGLDARIQDRAVYGRSLPGERSTSDIAYSNPSAQQQEPARPARLAGGGAYGSLGTYHAIGKRESPVAALRQRALSENEEESVETSSATSRRRQSQIADSDLLKHPPFKAGSFATSPRGLASPSSSLPKTSVLGSSVPKRLSINALPQQSLRTPHYGTEHAIASSGSASPKPAPMHRYSSSFAHRKRFTSQGSKAGESTTSSGRGSTSSKERSGQLPEGNDGSSGSGRTDEDDIAAFISVIESARALPSASTAKSPRPNTINLSKFKGMGIASSELADEMSSSSLKHPSLTPPSRRLSNVPGLSTSSSPGRALVHAPPVRSRLSTHSITQDSSETTPDTADQEQNSDDEEPFIFQQDNIL